MNSRRRFAEYLEMSGPGWEPRAARLGLATRRNEILADTIGEKLLPVGTLVSEIRATLGPEDSVVEAAIRYDLGLREDYVFEFVLSADLSATIDSGYERKAQRTLQLFLPKTAAEMVQCRRELIDLGVTARELRTAFGEPQDRSGWWPCETWTYPGVFAVELRLGVVEG